MSRARSIAARRRSRPNLAARVRVLWVFIAVLGTLAAFAGWKLATWPGFHPHPVVVSGANGHPLTPAAILARAQIDPNANVWLLDTHAIAARVDALPYVADAHVTRRPPAMVTIGVRERVPSACVRVDGHSVTIDTSRRVLEPSCVARALPMFVLPGLTLGAPGTFLTDPRLARLQRDAATLADAKLVTGELRLDRFDALEAVQTDGLIVRFGEDGDLAQKAALVGPILATLKPARATIAALDLRAPQTPVVQYRSGEEKSARPQNHVGESGRTPNI